MAADDDDDVKQTKNKPDYAAINIPDDDPTTYHYNERRAEILKMIEKKGSPHGISQTQLADRYGVSDAQISKDFDRLAEHIRERLPDRDRRALIVDTAVKKAIDGLMDRGEYRKAARTALDYDDWIYNFSDIEEIESRLSDLEE